MKNLVLSTIAILALAFTGVSCSSDDDDNQNSQIIAYEELPAEAQTFTETHFSELEILRVEIDIQSVDDYYEVKFVGGMEIEFDQNGNWTSVDGNNQAIPTGFINPLIVQYVADNYPDTSIESIEIKPYGFDVDLLNNTDLRFDTEGNFLGLDN